MSHNDNFVLLSTNSSVYEHSFEDMRAPVLNIGEDGFKRTRAWSGDSVKSTLLQDLNTSLENALGHRRLNDLKINWSAVIAMNVFAVSTTGQSVLFKLLSE
jgi:hypothetical protein